MVRAACCEAGSDVIWGVALSPDGSLVATASADRGWPSVRSPIRTWRSTWAKDAIVGPLTWSKLIPFGN